MLSFAVFDSPMAFRTLKYTVLVPSPDEIVKVGAVPYDCQEAPAKLPLSLAMYWVGEPEQELFRLTFWSYVISEPLSREKLLTVGATAVMLSDRTFDSPRLLRVLKYIVFVPPPALSVKDGAAEYDCQLAPEKLLFSLAM